MKRNNIYLKFIDETLKIIRGTRLPLYSIKYSKQTYDQHQLMVLVLFKEYMVADYRSFIQRLELMYPILDKLELENVPHFTTLQKFVSRISTYKFNRILNQTVKLFYNRGGQPRYSSNRCFRYDQLLCKLLLFIEDRYVSKEFPENLYICGYG